MHKYLTSLEHDTGILKCTNETVWARAHTDPHAHTLSPMCARALKNTCPYPNTNTHACTHEDPGQQHGWTRTGSRNRTESRRAHSPRFKPVLGGDQPGWILYRDKDKTFDQPASHQPPCNRPPYEQPPKIYIPCYLSATDEGIIEPIPFSIFIYKRRSQDVPGIQNIKDKRMGAHAMR